MRKRTRRRPEGHPRLRRPPRHPPPPAPRRPPSVPTRPSRLSTSRPSGTSPSPGSSGTRSNPGAIPRTRRPPSSTSIPPPLLTTTYQWRESANRHYHSGQRVAANTSRTLMVAVTKDSRSLAGTTRMERHVVTSPCPTSVVKNVGRPSPRRPASRTTPMACGTTRQRRCLAHLILPQGPYQVSNTIIAIFTNALPTRHSRFYVRQRLLFVIF